MLIPLGDDVNRRTLPTMTIVLIAANVLLFMFQWRVAVDSQPSGAAYEAFMRHWGLVPADFFGGHYVGVFTCMFLHGGGGHLFVNMFTLWLFAPTLEAALGSVRFLAFYLWWGVVASLAQALVDPTSDVPVIGASGAISGAIGAYFVTFGPLACIRIGLYGGILTGFQWIKFKIPASAYVFFWIIIPQMLGLSESLESGETQVAWFAHVGGFLAGMVALRFLAWDARRKLMCNRDGQLEIDSAGPAGAYGGAIGLASLALSQCPHCQAPLADEHRIDATMYRCPSAACQRLIFFTPTRLKRSG